MRKRWNEEKKSGLGERESTVLTLIISFGRMLHKTKGGCQKQEEEARLLLWTLGKMPTWKL
jgi:hypothetical protein